MKDFEIEEPNEVKLIVSEEMRSYIYDITKWAKFLSIIGYAVGILLLLGSFQIGSVLNSNPAALAALGPLAKGGSAAISLIYLLLAAFYFYPSMLLGRIASRGKQAVLFGDQENLDSTVLQMKSLFKFWGIITLVIIVAYVLLVILVGSGLAK
ncbi:MAG: hypothetical protein H7325_11505 [Pedobacter sp.]|nr:hypothetical protein [Pedobacter sp.]